MNMAAPSENSCTGCAHLNASAVPPNTSLGRANLSALLQARGEIGDRAISDALDRHRTTSVRFFAGDGKVDLNGFLHLLDRMGLRLVPDAEQSGIADTPVDELRDLVRGGYDVVDRLQYIGPQLRTMPADTAVALAKLARRGIDALASNLEQPL